jgi:starvation-inducible DNA-binding protein
MTAKRSEIHGPGDVRLARLLKRRADSALDVENVARRAHWEVRGPNHIALHGLFDQISANMDAHVTELAGVIKELGGEVSSESGLRAHGPAPVPFTEETSSGHGQVDELAHRLAELRRKLHRSQTKVARLGNAHASTACSGLMHDVDKYCQVLKTFLRPTH